MVEILWSADNIMMMQKFKNPVMKKQQELIINVSYKKFWYGRVENYVRFLYV